MEDEIGGLKSIISSSEFKKPEVRKSLLSMISVQIEQLIVQDESGEYSSEIGSLIVHLLKTMRNPDIVSLSA